MHVLGIFRGGCQACADGPDRLIGDRHASQIAGFDPSERAFELFPDHITSMAGLSLLERFAHAEHHIEAASKGRTHLGRAQFRRFAHAVASFGVAHEGPCAAAIQQHGGSGLAGTCPLGLVRHVLPTHSHGGFGQFISHGGQIGHGWEHDELGRAGVVFDPAGQGDRCRPVAVHLPISTDQWSP